MHRRPFTRFEIQANGISLGTLRWRLSSGAWQAVGPGVYVEGAEPLSQTERALANVLITGGVASYGLAGVLHGLDSVSLTRPYLTLPTGCITVRTAAAHRDLSIESVVSVDGYRCTSGLQTLLDLSAVTEDLVWEQALESALRKGLCTVLDIEESLARRRRGNALIRRVKKLRPNYAPSTESLLETLAVQLLRRDPVIPTPVRQHVIYNRWGDFVARVDLAFPNEGVFLELDGQQHKNQPVYDSHRQTKIVAATGWRVGRFTWNDIVLRPRPTFFTLRDLFGLR